MTEVIFKKDTPLWVRADYLEEATGNSAMADLMRLPMQCAHEWGLPETRQIKLTDKIGIEFVLIPHGVGYLGEKCEQKFVFPRPTYMSKCPITEEQYFAVTGKKPSAVAVKRGPVDSVNWNEAREFAAKIGCRLPYEAEWEYACRAGTKTRYALGDEWSKEWGNCNSARKTPVGTFLPNYWDLYDMHGNVWVWCEDDWDGSGIKQPPIREGEQRGPFVSCAAAPGPTTRCTVARRPGSGTRPASGAPTSASALSSEGEQRGPLESCAEGRGTTIRGMSDRHSEPETLHQPLIPALDSVSSSEGDHSGPLESCVVVPGASILSTVARPTATSVVPWSAEETLVSASSSEGEQRGPFGACGVGRGTPIQRAVARPTEAPIWPGLAPTTLASESSSEGEQNISPIPPEQVQSLA